MRCHGVSLESAGAIADLRYMNEGSHQLFQQIVRDGLLSGIGMAAFGDVLSEEDVEAIHDYVVEAAHVKWEEDHASDWWKGLRDWTYDKLVWLVTAIGL